MTTPAPLASALAHTFTDLRERPWADQLPLAAFADFLAEDPSRVLRGAAEHFTTSAFVFSPDLTHTLLCFHGKGDMWVQLGGHMEAGDPTPEEAALREVHEESGLSGAEFLDLAPIELHRHGLAATFGSCRAHWDVVYALSVDLQNPRVSPESTDVRWFPVDALPSGCAPGFEDQLENILDRLPQIRTA